ncbi:hypothetical protein NO658_004633 [Salmonella enterica]|nr:hypothetical protein [Salmonella enterica]
MVIFVRNQSPVSETFFHQSRAGRRHHSRCKAVRILANDFAYPVSEIFQESQQVVAFVFCQPFPGIRQTDTRTVRQGFGPGIRLCRVQMQPGGCPCQPLRTGRQQVCPSPHLGLAKTGCQRQDLVCTEHTADGQPAGNLVRSNLCHTHGFRPAGTVQQIFTVAHDEGVKRIVLHGYSLCVLYGKCRPVRTGGAVSHIRRPGAA